MPIESKAQQRFMYSQQNAPGKIGKVARDFIAATPKGAYKGLPARVKPLEKLKPRQAFGSLDGS